MLLPPEPSAWRFSLTAIGSKIENEHLSTEGTPNWHVQNLSTAELIGTAAVGLRDGLGLELAIPLRYVRARVRFEDLNRQPFVPADGDIHHRNETLFGIRDPLLDLHLGKSGAWDLSARLGVSIPLGRTEENPFALGREGIAHQHIQFGSGTWDPLLGAGVRRRAGGLDLSASGLARFTLYENTHGYRAGHRYAAFTSADRTLGSRWSGNLGLELTREEAERWDGKIEEEGNLGRTDLLLTLGLGRSVERLGFISVTAHIPLYTEVTGAQLDYPLLLSLGWVR
jgi:hypothetical protein